MISHGNVKLILVFAALAIAFPDKGRTQPKESITDTLVLVIGAAGNEDFQIKFSAWADAWQELAKNRGWNCIKISEQTPEGLQPLEQLRTAIEQSVARDNQLWITMIGHGTYLQGVSKFNLQGPDVTPELLDKWLGDNKAPCIINACFSSSAPFLSKLSAPDRIIVSSTRSGSEMNFSRFGEYLAKAISALEADIDHDREVSVFEAFLVASKATEDFYTQEGRLLTEHAIFDDDGNAKGTPRDFFQGIELTGKAKDESTVDGTRARQTILYSSVDAIRLDAAQSKRRKQIESQISVLKTKKETMSQADYYAQLEQYLLEMADLYSAAEAHQTAPENAQR